jgi:hypothetical protein
MKRLILILAGLLLNQRSDAALTVTTDGGASNITATTTAIGLKLTATNAPAILHTNFFGWGLINQGTNIFAYGNIFTNLATTGFGTIQTNLTGLPSNTDHYYCVGARDVSNGMVTAAGSVRWRTLIGGVSTNKIAGASNVLVLFPTPSNTGTFLYNGVEVSIGGGATNAVTIILGGNVTNAAARVLNFGTLATHSADGGTSTVAVLTSITITNTGAGAGIVNGSGSVYGIGTNAPAASNTNIIGTASTRAIALDSSYQPSTTRDVIVTVNPGITPDVGADCKVDIMIEAANPPTIVFTTLERTLTATATPVTFVCPKANYYKLKTTTVAGSCTFTNIGTAKEYAIGQ